MRCRHTVPDWHRYVVSGEDARPIFAACRLLVKDGERAADSRAIACMYWGRQRECPLYDGPESSPREQPGPMRSTTADVVTAPEKVWPVRQPGAPDVQRLCLMALTGVSVVLLGLALVLTVSALQGRPVRSNDFVVMLLAASVSTVTLVLTLLRLWVKR
jgi:hypothetical protein